VCVKRDLCIWGENCVRETKYVCEKRPIYVKRDICEKRGVSVKRDLHAWRETSKRDLENRAMCVTT